MRMGNNKLVERITPLKAEIWALVEGIFEGWTS